MDGNKKVTIVTHSSEFHADDVLAVAVVCLYLDKQGNDYEIIRSREKDLINKGDYVLDVGGIYDVNINRFDHHQIGGAGVRENGIPYAAFGLIWKSLGKELCGNDIILKRIDEKVVQFNDAGDNGISVIEKSLSNSRPYALGDLFHAFLPSWKEAEVENLDEIFVQAVSYAKFILSREIKKEKDNLEAEEIVKNIYATSSDKRLIIMDKMYPSNEVLRSFPEPMFVVYPSENGKWGLKGIKIAKDSYTRRKFLPDSWAGKRDEELEKVTGVSGSVFCHTGRFIAIANTKEGILKMAEIALNS